MTSYAVVMPAFNEAEGISSFLEEIVDAFGSDPVSLHVVDDRSTDSTVRVVTELAGQGLPVRVESNARNLGHGPSTVAALRQGLASAADVVVAVDGDGQFLGADIASLARSVDPGWPGVLEGCRVARTDPGYRRLVSAGTRALVASVAGARPRDANTPLRVYPRPVLERLLEQLPEAPVVPNLMISALVRRGGLEVRQVEVRSLPRRGTSAVGTAWGGLGRFLPSRRFLRFCRRALSDWRSFRASQA